MVHVVEIRKIGNRITTSEQRPPSLFPSLCYIWSATDLPLAVILGGMQNPTYKIDLLPPTLFRNSQKLTHYWKQHGNVFSYENRDKRNPSRLLWFLVDAVAAAERWGLSAQFVKMSFRLSYTCSPPRCLRHPTKCAKIKRRAILQHSPNASNSYCW